MKTPTNNTKEKMEALLETDENPPPNDKTFRLLPDNYENELFRQNIAYLKVKQPSLYNTIVNHKCLEYRLCSNSVGCPNIVNIQNNQLIYAASTMDEILTPIHKNIENVFCTSLLPANIINGANEKWKKNNPIQDNMMGKLYKSGILSKMKITVDDLNALQKYNTDYLPLLRVYGIGLGYHLTELIKQKNISYMTVYEPHLDLFYTSLFTTPWQLIFKYFAINNKGICLVVGTTPDQAITSNQVFIQQRLLPLTSFFYRFIHFNNSPLINEILEKEPQEDEIQRHQTDAGWYEDQRVGFYYSAKNIREKNAFFSGQKTDLFFRAFIVGSGPSLNQTIDYIKEHQDDAIIISCGTAITPLLKAGIIPDYQVVQERPWHIEKYEEGHDLRLIKKVSLLKLNVISPIIDKHYKETLVFQKYHDPGSTLLDNSYAVTTCVNPTVTNAGISMAAELGVNEVYLFGVDYGAPIDSETMHASNTIYENSLDDTVKTKTSLELPGNLGSVIRSSDVLSFSHRTTERRISYHPEIEWFNVAEGALISGATPVDENDLPKTFPQRIQKEQLKDEIRSCFNNTYPTDTISEQLRVGHLQQVDQYLQAILGFTESAPQTREEIVFVLSLMYQAMNTGADQTHFLPTSLLSYGFKQFINNVYIQTAIQDNDASAVLFFHTAKQILLEYIEAIIKDMEIILTSIESNSELEFYN